MYMRVFHAKVRMLQNVDRRTFFNADPSDSSPESLRDG